MNPFHPVLLLEKLPKLHTSLKIKLSALNGYQDPTEQLKRFAIRLTVLTQAIVFGFSALGIFMGNPVEYILSGFGLAVIEAILAWRGLDRQLLARKRQMAVQLPVFLNKLVLLINAGEHVKQAIVRCAGQPNGNVQTPLDKELARLANEMTQHKPMQQALEDFSRRCGIREASIFATTVLLNSSRGTGDFTLALNDLSESMWERRKALAKSLGEEASAKLVFPMVIIFMVVMGIVAAPALLLMKDY